MVDFIDRVPTYPGRVRLTPVPGSSDLFDLTRADQPTVLGTPVNRALFEALQNEQNETGAYVGTGNGASITRTITFAFEPKAFVIIGNGYTAIWVSGSDRFYSSGNTAANRPVTWDGPSVSWTGQGTEGYDGFMNTLGKNYYWIAFR